MCTKSWSGKFPPRAMSNFLFQAKPLNNTHNKEQRWSVDALVELGGRIMFNTVNQGQSVTNNYACNRLVRNFSPTFIFNKILSKTNGNYSSIFIGVHFDIKKNSWNRLTWLVSY